MDIDTNIVLRISLSWNLDLYMTYAYEMLRSDQPQWLNEVSWAVEPPIKIEEWLSINSILRTKHPLVSIHNVNLHAWLHKLLILFHDLLFNHLFLLEHSLLFYDSADRLLISIFLVVSNRLYQLVNLCVQASNLVLKIFKFILWFFIDDQTWNAKLIVNDFSKWISKVTISFLELLEHFSSPC